MRERWEWLSTSTSFQAIHAPPPLTYCQRNVKTWPYDFCQLSGWHKIYYCFQLYTKNFPITFASAKIFLSFTVRWTRSTVFSWVSVSSVCPHNKKRSPLRLDVVMNLIISTVSHVSIMPHCTSHHIIAHPLFLLSSLTALFTLYVWQLA